MLFSKKYNTRSSRKRSMGKRISKKRNMIGGDFPINVNFQGQTITFNVHPNDWISSLAWKIEDWSKKVRAHNLDIYFNGNLLNFLTTIQYNEITHNSTIVVKEKDVGIMPPPPPSPPLDEVESDGMLSTLHFVKNIKISDVLRSQMSKY